ncbi:hypothetical protein [Bifidobacterium myosotis]|uniref:hypothetical protein n=1 Tax=Bifidobacterium myosotis TaxID=1630166 RepID=UPI00117893CF|nr:hypothetical protein [Bifidobacterium myosotis]
MSSQTTTTHKPARQNQQEGINQTAQRQQGSNLHEQEQERKPACENHAKIVETTAFPRRVENNVLDTPLLPIYRRQQPKNRYYLLRVGVFPINSPACKPPDGQSSQSLSHPITALICMDRKKDSEPKSGLLNHPKKNLVKLLKIIEKL